MIDIAQSLFLQALGLAIANSLWQAALLWLLCFLMNSIAKPKANSKYLITAGAALLSLAWFVFTTGVYYWQLSSASIGSLHNAAAAMEFSIVSKWFYISQALIPYLSCAYMLVTALLAIRLFNGFREVKTLRAGQLQKPPIAWRLFVRKYAAVLQIDKQVEVWLSAKVNSPLTIGFWKPIILLPLAGMNHLTPQQVEAILLHELSHIRRYDYLVNILLQVAEILLFFNPFVRLLLKQCYQERENSCDDWVLQFNYNGADYARALLSIEQTAHSHLLALGVNNHHKFYLLHRITRIVSPEKKSTDYRNQLSTLAFVMLTMIMTNGFIPAITAKQHAPQENTMATSDFFSPVAQMNNSVLNEIEAAAEAFSIARNVGLKKTQVANDKKANNNVHLQPGAIINMITEEEERVLAVNAASDGLDDNNEALANAAIFETNTAEADGILKAKEAIGSALQSDYLQAWQDRFAKTQQAIQHELLILETEGKTKKAAAEKKYQKIKVLELELQTILAAIPSAFRYKTNNEKLNTELKYQEKLISTAADKYATTFADFAEQQYGFSYNFNTVAPNEKSFSTGNPISAAIASVPKSTGHTYMVSGRNIVRSKDKEHITISISDTDKEISICLPNDTQEATMATLKQLEAAGVLAIEPKLNKQPKAAMPKKPRVIVSL